MRLLDSWYLEIFNVPTEIGVAQRILETATITRDGPLAILAFQVLQPYKDSVCFESG